MNFQCRLLLVWGLRMESLPTPLCCFSIAAGSGSTMALQVIYRENAVKIRSWRQRECRCAGTAVGEVLLGQDPLHVSSLSDAVQMSSVTLNLTGLQCLLGRGCEREESTGSVAR